MVEGVTDQLTAAPGHFKVEKVFLLFLQMMESPVIGGIAGNL
jgi:hypothetical protein